MFGMPHQIRLIRGRVDNADDDDDLDDDLSQRFSLLIFSLPKPS